MGVSAILNTVMLVRDWNNPKFTAGAKASLLAGTGLSAAVAGAGVWAALPVKGALLANRFGLVFAGAAGAVFTGINMVLTIGSRTATPVEKTFASAGFVAEIATLAFEVAAISLPAGAALGPLGLGGWAAITGVAVLGCAALQLLLAHNSFLNRLLARLWG